MFDGQNHNRQNGILQLFPLHGMRLIFHQFDATVAFAL